MKCRVFINADGSIRIMIPNMKRWDEKSCSEEEFCQAVFDADMKKDHSLMGLKYRDVDASTLPRDRMKRHAWRWSDNPGVYVDETVPDPPDPRQETLKRIDEAKTIEELKKIIKEIA